MSEGARAAHHSAATQWLLVVIGVLSTAAGVVVLAQPAIALATLAVIMGILLLLDGIVETALALASASDWRGFLGVVLGVASAIIGVLLIRHPLHGVVAVALLVGLWLIISSMLRFATALNAAQHRGRDMAVALIELLAGVVIVSSPGIGVGTLALFVGISFILRGLALCAVGWLVARLPSELDAPPSVAVTAT